MSLDVPDVIRIIGEIHVMSLENQFSLFCESFKKGWLDRDK